LAVAYTPETLMQRLATTGTEVTEGGLSGRLKLWKAGLRAFEEKPVIGYGTGNFKGAITPILGTASQVAHNSYISLLVEQGVVGWALYMSMLIMVFLAVMALPPPERRFGLILLATLGTAMLPLTWEDHRPAWFVMAALLGFAKSSRGMPMGMWRSHSQSDLAPSASRPTARPAGPMVGVRRDLGPDPS
jgi:O-antigen ligase